MKIYGKYRILTLAAGIATALLIVFSQLFYFQAATYCQKKAENEQKEKKLPVGKTGTETGREAYISLPTNSIPSVSHIEISDGISFVLEILLVTNEEETNTETLPLANGLFQTLFRFIIAPNAP
jgi:hypothetical protein